MIVTDFITLPSLAFCSFQNLGFPLTFCSSQGLELPSLSLPFQHVLEREFQASHYRLVYHLKILEKSSFVDRYSEIS